MTSEEIRKKFLAFFEQRGHKIVHSSSLIPDDPSVLLTTAGMQQFKRYFTGELNAKKDFGSLNTVSIQKCFRTSDIDEVGDASHLTFFEMLGNFSFGDYFKEEAIKYSYEFITKDLGIAPNRISVSIFKGDKDVPRDEESFKIWHEKIGISKNKIGENGREDNFWGPTGSEGPCGPTSEIYIDGLEIWNLVFNEYYQRPDKTLEKLKIPGVDTGMGLERLAMVVQKVPTIFETDLFKSIIKSLPEELPIKTKRIIADHARGIAFLITDGVRPSNKETGYVLRRLIRRVTTFVYLGIIAKNQEITLEDLLKRVISDYDTFYKELDNDSILNVFHEEQNKFLNTLDAGLKELNKVVDAKSAFRLYESYGVPYEVIKDLGGVKTKMITREAFDEEFKQHQEISKAGSVKKFGGHGLILNTGELKAGDEAELQKVMRLHTATHLLHRALREVLGDSVHQMGSDITTERARFDFSFNRKMTSEELRRVEEIVNEKVKEDLPVQFKEMSKTEAEKTGALHFFKEKYPEKVKVYFIGKDLANAWSKEFCGGPHVQRTGEIGKIKILKEEAVGAGARRLRATVA